MQTIRIGRSTDTNQLVLPDDMMVSRQHAIVTIDDKGNATIRDLNSTHGTWVDGARISSEQPITAQSVIKVGGTALTLGQIISQAGKNHPHGQAPRPQHPSLSNRISIGRTPGNTIVAPVPDVSGSHAAMGTDQQGNVVIVDLGSTNGTFVNGERIHGARTLRPGDQVRLGATYVLDWTSAIGNRSDNQHHRKGLSRTVTVAAAVTILAIVAAVIGYFKFVERDWTPQQVYSHYKSSVALILNQYTYDIKLHGSAPSEYTDMLAPLDNMYVNGEGEVESGASGSFGTGFFISEDGRLMTNKHVLYPVGNETKNADAIKRTVENTLNALARKTGNPAFAQLATDITVDYRIISTGIALNDTHVSSFDDFMPATPIKKSDNDEVDVAIIQTHSKQTPKNCTIVDIKDFSRPEQREIGGKVYTLGFPSSLVIGNTSVGLEANNQSGEITQDRGENTFGHNITIHQGASGSPVFDARGRFAGIIVSGYLGLSQGYNHAVQPDKAAALF